MTGGFFAVLDDIATLLDDAAMMSKVAAKKTVGILGDDLAVNAEKATGFAASRELPVLWAITKGSIINKLILLPLAFLMSAYLPWLIIPILLLGGAYLSYEGVEKIFHVVTGRSHHEKTTGNKGPDEDPAVFEKKKIKSAIRTDFILSIEIVMIALGTVMDQTLFIQIIVVSCVAILATLGVYGVVALIVRMDDTGFFLLRLSRRSSGVLPEILRHSGRLLVAALPRTIRLLAVIGTIAMLLVGGGMYTHNIGWLHHLMANIPSLVANLMTGLLVGAAAFLFVSGIQRVSAGLGKSASH